MFFAHNAQVQARFYTEDLAGVEDHFARVSPLLSTSRSRSSAGDNIVPIGIASHAAWHLGRAERARERIARAIDLATQSHDPYDMAMAMHYKGNLYWCLRAPRRAEAVARRLLSHSEAQGFRYTVDLARVLLGWAKTELGGAAEGVEMIYQGLTGLAAAGANVAITYFLTLLGQAQARNGDVELGLRTMTDALAANPQERIWRPDTLRSRGNYGSRRGSGKWRKPISATPSRWRRQWEIRPWSFVQRHVSLLERPGDRRGARESLAPIYASFKEGLRTPDLRDAKLLLNRMPHEAGR